METAAYVLSRLAPVLFEWAVMLFPLAVYLLWLGFGVGRSAHPVILSGVRDTIYLALALSGFALIGPPTWLLERFARMSLNWYLFVYAIYLLLLTALLWTWISKRRKSLLVYSINPEAFSPLMIRQLDALGLPYQVIPGKIAVAEGRLVLDLRASTLLYTLTLTWTGDETLWNQIRPGLLSDLRLLATSQNPAGAILPLWGGLILLFVSLSSVIFGWYWAYMAV
jgi:hypothetical protein